MGGRGRNFLVYGLILIVLIVVVYAILGRGGGSSQTVPLAGGGGEDLLSLIERDLGQIESIRVSPNQVTLDYPRQRRLDLGQHALAAVGRVRVLQQPRR